MRHRFVKTVAGCLAVLTFGQPVWAASSFLGSWYLYDKYRGYSGGASTDAVGLDARVAFGPNAYFGTGLDLFENVRVLRGETGRQIVADTTTDSHFNAIATLLTNGHDDPVFVERGYFHAGSGYSAGGAPWIEAFWAAQPLSTVGSDFTGYTLDRIVAVVDYADWVSPGSDPNRNGNWTDYQILTHLDFYGTPVPEPVGTAILGVLGISLLRRPTRGVHPLRATM